MTSRPVLPDYLVPKLGILFVGINPGLRSAALGHHYAGPSNRFWKLLYEASLVSEPPAIEMMFGFLNGGSDLPI